MLLLSIAAVSLERHLDIGGRLASIVTQITINHPRRLLVRQPLRA